MSCLAGRAQPGQVVFKRAQSLVDTGSQSAELPPLGQPTTGPDEFVKLISSPSNSLLELLWRLGRFLFPTQSRVVLFILTPPSVNEHPPWSRYLESLPGCLVSRVLVDWPAILAGRAAHSTSQWFRVNNIQAHRDFRPASTASQNQLTSTAL